MKNTSKMRAIKDMKWVKKSQASNFTKQALNAFYTTVQCACGTQTRVLTDSANKTTIISEKLCRCGRYMRKSPRILTSELSKILDILD